MKKSCEVVLPVTPSAYTISDGMNIEVLNVHAFGDYVVAGNKTLERFSVSALLPSKTYPFMTPKATTSPPDYIKTLLAMMNAKEPVQYIITGKKVFQNKTTTILNRTVLIEQIEQTEDDGSGDVKLTISLRAYRALGAVKTVIKIRGNTIVHYKVKKGDTLKSICHKYYGKTSLYKKVAKYNKIKNTALLKVGKQLKLPAEAKL